ncbi:fatty acid desaturase [Ralstonia solanacearum]|uniref:fatty acid desaturase n=1 Tax=Ralstonia solanacearum TaxID=305 RepID=UPI003D271B0E
MITRLAHEAHATFNNCSFLDKLIFHPAGDAYHLLHHLYPAIPWWRQGRRHRYLMAVTTTTAP